jgi:hypothetical protein
MKRALFLILVLSGCGGTTQTEEPPCPGIPARCGKVENPDGGAPFCPDLEFIKKFGCLG